MFDYFVDAESHEFTRWTDAVPGYSGTPHSGISPDGFVHTVSTEVNHQPFKIVLRYGPVEGVPMGMLGTEFHHVLSVWAC